MKALLLLAALSASANTRGRIVTPRQNATTVAPVPALPIVVLNAATFATTVNPTLRVDGPAHIPVLTPLRQLAPADAPTPAPDAPSAPIRPIAADPVAARFEQATTDETPAAEAPARAGPLTAPADAPGFVRRTLAALRLISNPFGRPTRPTDAPPEASALHPLLTGSSTGLELEGLSIRAGVLRGRDGSPAPELGRGLRGVVNVHPGIEGAVIKTVRMVAQSNELAAASESTPAQLSAKEEETARALEALGAGPRFFGSGVLDGERLSVRERVYGETVETLASARAYGPDEHALVLEMLGLLAGAGKTATDLKTANIMIGRTASDPRRRAYLVDGGALAALPAGVAAEKRLDAVLDSYVPTTSMFGSTARKELAKALGRHRAPKARPAPANEAERLDREFMKLDLWGQAAPRARAEIAAARAQRLSKAAFKEYVQAETAAAFERIKAARGTSNIGFHYNLHGGQRDGYVGRGLKAGVPDDGSRDVIHWQARPEQVYFFQTSHDGAYNAMDAHNPAMNPWPSRMGHVLNVFALDAPAIEDAKADGRIRNHTTNSMDFHGMWGIPYSAYLAPPVHVFDGSAKKALGLGRLTRDEENLATVRYLEAALLAGGDYVPR